MSLPFSIAGLGFWRRLLHPDLITANIRAVEGLHRCLGFSGGGHLNKAKPFGHTGFFIDYQCAGLHLAVLFEQSAKFSLSSGSGEIAY